MGIKFVIPPITTEVTLTVTSQVADADKDAPARENDVASGVALIIPPEHVVLAFGVDDIRIPFAVAPDVPSMVK